MVAFHDIRFPLNVSYGSTGGPERRTSVIELASGFEERNALWQNSRRRYNAGYGVRSLDDMHRVISFFEARNGKLHGFLFCDLLDWKSGLPSAAVTASDQEIGIGDGATKIFPLTKIYRSGVGEWKRVIAKPVVESVLIEVNGVNKNHGVDWAVGERGEIVFVSTPANGAVIQAGFEFNVPVRFDTDYLAIDLAAFQAGEIPDVPLVEIRI